MAQQIYLNLPVSNLERSVRFFSALGYRFNPQFTDENATCMIVADNIHVMLLVQSYFKTFTPKAVADAGKTTEVLICLSCDSRAEVDGQVAKAVAGGGRTYNEPKDHGFMYQHGYEDPDGHIWELAWMDPSGMPAA
jgi:predicted lactoylglutathione lyase